MTRDGAPQIALMAAERGHKDAKAERGTKKGFTQRKGEKEEGLMKELGIRDWGWQLTVESWELIVGRGRLAVMQRERWEGIRNKQEE